jgi:hypothetical protein
MTSHNFLFIFKKTLLFTLTAISSSLISMTSDIMLYVCLLIVICCSATSSADEIPTMTSNNMNNNPNILSNWYKNYQLAKKLNSELIERSLSVSSTNLQRRNVIMPRICYFTRVTNSGIHQKLCLPYDHED